MAEHNDKRHVVMAALLPTKVHDAVARAWRYQPLPVVVVFLDTVEKTFSTMLVPQ